MHFFRPKLTSSSKKHSTTVIEELCHQFSLADLRKSTNNFDQNRIIGEGGFGDQVYKGCLKHNGATDYSIVVKRFHKNSDLRLFGCENEIELLCQLHHPNLISLIGFCNCKDEMIMVYEYMPNGSLRDRLYRRDMKPLSWKKRLEICIGAARGLHYLHTGAKRTIFHRNITPHCILLDNNMVPRLGDFGLSLQGPRFPSKPKPIEVVGCAGTYGYIAPEYAKYGTFTEKCDVYSFGMVLLVVAFANEKQTISDKKNMLQKNVVGEISNGPTTSMDIWNFVQTYPAEEIIEPTITGKIAPECWKVFMDITERCLKNDPNERPAIGEAEVELEHALALQEEADAKKTSGDHILLSRTIINVSE